MTGLKMTQTQDVLDVGCKALAQSALDWSVGMPNHSTLG